MATKAMTKTTTKVVGEDKKVEAVKRTWDKEDYIPCRSIVNGALYVVGNKSNDLYTWADYGDVQEVQYQDLVWMIRTRANKEIYEPRIVIEDEDLVSEFSQLSDLYDSLYTNSDLVEIINLPANQLKKQIELLPKGAQNAIKGLATTMIDSHQLDSVGKIKVLDEIFGTQMLLTLVQE